MTQFGRSTAVNLTRITSNTPIEKINDNFRKIQVELLGLYNDLEPKARAGQEAYDHLDRFLGGQPPVSRRYVAEKIEEAEKEIEEAEKRIAEAEKAIQEAEKRIAEAEMEIAQAEQDIVNVSVELAQQRDFLENFAIEVSEQAYRDALDRTFEWSFTSQQLAASFIRNSTAQLPDGTVVGVNIPRYIPIKKYL